MKLCPDTPARQKLITTASARQWCKAGGVRGRNFECADVTGLKDDHKRGCSMSERLAGGGHTAILSARSHAMRGAMMSQVLGSRGGGDRAALDSHLVDLCPQLTASWKIASVSVGAPSTRKRRAWDIICATVSSRGFSNVRFSYRHTTSYR